jgi:hypothetical protein
VPPPMKLQQKSPGETHRPPDASQVRAHPPINQPEPVTQIEYNFAIKLGGVSISE